MKSLLTVLVLATLHLGTTSFGSPETAPSNHHSEISSRVIWFDIMVSDFPRAAKFYATLFGWSFKSQSSDYYVIQSGSRAMGGISTLPTGTGGNGVAIYFEVKDIKVKLQQAEALGAQVVVSPTSVPSGQGTFALFRDLDGNPIGLFAKDRS